MSWHYFCVICSYSPNQKVGEEAGHTMRDDDISGRSRPERPVRWWEPILMLLAFGLYVLASIWLTGRL